MLPLKGPDTKPQEVFLGVYQKPGYDIHDDIPSMHPFFGSYGKEMGPLISGKSRLVKYIDDGGFTNLEINLTKWKNISPTWISLK